jgi:UDP-glucose 4-epimerase
LLEFKFSQIYTYLFIIVVFQDINLNKNLHLHKKIPDFIMNALVTGGLGFIGSHVVDLLIAEGLTVTVVDNLSTGNKEFANQKAEYIYRNVEELEAGEVAKYDYVFHLAALPRIQPSFTDPEEHENANVIATIRLLEALKTSKKIKKLVYSASSSCYGNPIHTPTAEDSQIAPLSPYALQKYAAEQYCLILGERNQIPINTLRYFNAYGPRSFNPLNRFNAYTSVIGIFHYQKKNGEKLTITGDGSQQRDFVHVRDIAKANFLAAVTDKNYSFYNIGFGTCYSILEIAEKFNHPYIFIPERKGEAKITLADISKIKNELGWSPKIGLEEGIQSYEEYDSTH